MTPFTQYFEKGRSTGKKIRSEAGREEKGLITKGHEETLGGDGNIPHFYCGGGCMIVWVNQNSQNCISKQNTFYPL